MSTDPKKPGGKTALDEAVAETKALIDEAAGEETEAQLDLLEPISAEEAAEAYTELGGNPGPLTVLKHAREKRKQGRPRGVRNRRTADTIAYLQQFGPDPAVALMKVIGESEEAMVARSRQVDPVKRQMTMADARAMRIRAAETMMPYFHGKQPVQVDHTIRGVRIVQEIGEVRRTAAQTLEGRILGVLPPEDYDPEEGE